jgi:hypothetical protein
MLRKFHDVDQSTPEWHDLREGLITASTFSDFFMGTTTIGYKAAIAKVALGRLGIKVDSFKGNWNTEKGHKLEETGKEQYELATLETITNGGFYTLGDYLGASPDGHIGTNRLFENKGKTKPNTITDAINDWNAGVRLTERSNKNHWWQVMFQLYVSGKEICVYQINADGLNPMVQELRITPEIKTRIESKISEIIPLIESQMENIKKHIA